MSAGRRHLIADPPVDVIHIDQKRLAAQGEQRIAQADRAKVAVDVGQGLAEKAGDRASVCLPLFNSPTLTTTLPW